MQRRLDLLEAYEQVSERLNRVLKRPWRNKKALLMRLCEVFPDIPKEKLADWIYLEPARFTQEILAYHLASLGETIQTAETIAQILKQARRDRKHVHNAKAEMELMSEKVREEFLRAQEGGEQIRMPVWLDKRPSDESNTK